MFITRRDKLQENLFKFLEANRTVRTARIVVITQANLKGWGGIGEENEFLFPCSRTDVPEVHITKTRMRGEQGMASVWESSSGCRNHRF